VTKIIKTKVTDKEDQNEVEDNGEESLNTNEFKIAMEGTIQSCEKTEDVDLLI
jgi:hypothetical protein